MFLKKLKVFSVDTKRLNLFYTSVIQSVAVFGLIIWYNSASVMDKQQVDKISCYQWLPSGKRLCSVPCKTKSHAESFVPKSVMILNKTCNICKYMIALLCIYKYIDIAVLLHMCQHVTKYLNGLIKYILSYVIPMLEFSS